MSRWWSAGQYAEALPLLKKAFQGYESLHLEEDVGPGPPAMQAWIAEAQAGTHRFDEALKNYQAAAAGLAEDEAHFDDARCDLAMVQTKIANTLLRMGKAREAASYFDKALAEAKLSVSLEQNDLPALYAAAEAYSGAGDVAAIDARNLSDSVARLKMWNNGCAAYEKSLGVWKHISNPSRLSGNDYLASDPRDIEQRLTACKAELAKAAHSDAVVASGNLSH